MKRIISIISLLIAVLQVTADDLYVKMSSLDEIDTRGTYLLVSVGYIGKAFGSNVINTLSKVSWMNDSKTLLTVPNEYCTSGLLFIKLEVVDANSYVYALRISETGKYLNNSSSTYLNQVDNYSSKRARWIIAKSSDGLIIKSNNSSSYSIKKKSSNDFYCTSSTASTNKSVVLYKKIPSDETITIGSARYATYVSSNALDFSGQTEITPYIITQSTNTAAILETVEKIPAKTPVVVSGSPGTYQIPVAASSDAVTGNLLVASDGTVKGDGRTIYALSSLSAGVGFYLVETEVSIPAGRCFLRIQERESSPSYIRMTKRETTAIHTLESLDDDSCIYTLSGQRVAHPHKGVYIYKGKKILIR